MDVANGVFKLIRDSRFRSSDLDGGSRNHGMGVVGIHIHRDSATPPRALEKNYPSRRRMFEKT